MIWTEEDGVKLRDLWAAGYSASQIGLEFNVSRNAILGKIHRMGIANIQRKVNADRAISRRQTKRAASPRPQKPKFNFGSVWGPYPKTESDAFVPMASDIVSLHKTILELREGDCRWPEGDGPFTFCGHPVEPGKSYCAGHCSIAYHNHFGWSRPDSRYRDLKRGAKAITLASISDHEDAEVPAA